MDLDYRANVSYTVLLGFILTKQTLATNFYTTTSTSLDTSQALTTTGPTNTATTTPATITERPTSKTSTTATTSTSTIAIYELKTSTNTGPITVTTTTKEETTNIPSITTTLKASTTLSTTMKPTTATTKADIITTPNEVDTTVTFTTDALTTTVDETDICDSSPCQRNGTCIRQGDDFICDCIRDPDRGVYYSGLTCQEESNLSPVIDSIRPNKGPIAGGTRLTVTGRFYTFFVFRVIINGTLPCLVNTTEQISRNGFDEAYAEIPAVGDHYIDTEWDLVVFFNNEDIAATTFKKSFIYKGNPEITGIHPTELLDVGGTQLTVTGESMDSVETPRLEITITRISDRLMKKVYGDCEGKNATQMNCTTPRLGIHDNDTDAWTSLSWRKRDVTFKQESLSLLMHSMLLQFEGRPDGRIKRTIADIELVIGFVLDGFDEYEDISKANSTKYLADEFDVVDPPHLHEWDKVVEFDPHEENDTINILGRGMSKGVSVADYLITIGDGICSTTESSLSDNAIDCYPPSKRPANPDKDGAHTVMVNIGTSGELVYIIGHLKYKSTGNINFLMFVGVPGAALFIAAIVALFSIIYKEVKEARIRDARESQDNNAVVSDNLLAFVHDPDRRLLGSPVKQPEDDKGNARVRNWVSASYFRMSEYFNSRQPAGDMSMNLLPPPNRSDSRIWVNDEVYLEDKGEHLHGRTHVRKTYRMVRNQDQYPHENVDHSEGYLPLDGQDNSNSLQRSRAKYMDDPYDVALSVDDNHALEDFDAHFDDRGQRDLREFTRNYYDTDPDYNTEMKKRTSGRYLTPLGHTSSRLWSKKNARKF